MRSERPAAILTTGAGITVPFAWVGRLYGVPTVYVESFTRIDELSLTARLISPIASRLYAQWPELAGTTPRLRLRRQPLPQVDDPRHHRNQRAAVRPARERRGRARRPRVALRPARLSRCRTDRGEWIDFVPSRS